jgi:transcriptional regulator with PAS, ATPase and Fis domain
MYRGSHLNSANSGIKSRIVVLTRTERSGLRLKNQLDRLFGDMFEVDCRSVESGIDSFIVADLVISNSYQVTGEFVKFLTPGTDIYVVRSTLTREAWEKIMNIPPMSRILVVASDYDESVMTVAMLYELGARHLELIPFTPGTIPEEDVKIALILNEFGLVPASIEKVISIGERVLDSYALYDVLGKLGKINKETVQIIISHMGEIIPRSPGLLSMLNNIVEMKHHLEFLVDVIDEGIVAFNDENRILFINKWASELLGVNSLGAIGCDAREFFGSRGLQQLAGLENLRDELVSLGGVQHIVNLTRLSAFNERIGGVATFKKCDEIQRLELKFRQNVRKKGYITRYNFDDIVGVSTKIQEAKKLALKFAKADTSILILGESGTGKELFAQAIHNISNRKDNPFIAFNCAAVTESLIESELFGYEEGAFTGARKGGKPGLFELAHRGTVFLDEIGDIPMPVQAMLLRVLQEKEVIRVGGTDVIPVDIRIIAATNQDLWKMVSAGTFRRDLYYRINVLCMRLPPLSERVEDIPCLVAHLLEKRGVRKDIPKNIMKTFMNYGWPGNIRELGNCLEHMVNVNSGSFELSDLPDWVFVDGVSAEKKLGLERLGDPGELLCILTALRKAQESKSGAGRKNLHEIVKSCGKDLTENEIRSRLKVLEQAGLVTVRRGRGGSRLSEQADELLASCPETG